MNAVRFFRLAGFVSLLLFVQTQVAIPLPGKTLRPDLLLPVVVYCGLAMTTCSGALWCVLLGYLVELFSVCNAGLLATSYLAALCVIRLLRRLLNFDTLPELVLLLLVCLGIKYSLVLFCFHYLFEYPTDAVRGSMLMQALYTALLFPLVFAATARVHHTPLAARSEPWP